MLQANAGIFLWEVPLDDGADLTTPMALCPSITTNATFCKWSRVVAQLAIGTQQVATAAGRAIMPGQVAVVIADVVDTRYDGFVELRWPSAYDDRREAGIDTGELSVSPAQDASPGR